MEFLNVPQNYRPEAPPLTPYLRAKQEWDDRIGATVVQAKNWRLALFFTCSVSLCLSLANIVQLRAQKVIPMVVAVDRQTGEATVVGKALEGYRTQGQEIQYFLLRFVSLVRSVPTDPVVIRKNWMDAYKFLRKEAASTLNQITNSDPESPLKKIGSETILVQPLSVLAVPGANSFQVRWTETRFDRNGSQTGKYTMMGLFAVEVEAPTDEETILVNPLGIRIKSFQWNREL